MTSNTTHAPWPAVAAKRRTRLLICLVASTLVPRHAAAQQLLAGEKAAAVTDIPGVVAAGAKWQIVWAGFQTADGIVGTPDGGVLFAQEQGDSIRKLDVNGKEFIYITDAHGPGAVGPDGKDWATPQGVRNTAMTIYTIPKLAEGFKGRLK